MNEADVFLSILALISSSSGHEAEFNLSSNLGILSPVLNKKQFFGTYIGVE